MSKSVIIDGVTYVPENTGGGNTGHCNTGDLNTGYRNTGDMNTGDRNTGDRNTGDRNTGNGNTGYCNTGYCNTGYWNTGFCNTGYCNTGNCNTGYCNTGNCNTGYWNTGDRNTGFFCTETPQPYFFDHPTELTLDEAIRAIPAIDLPIGAEFVCSDDMSDEEKQNNPNHVQVGGFLKKHELPIQTSFALAWSKMSDSEKDKWRKLPNIEYCTPEKSITLFGVDITK